MNIYDKNGWLDVPRIVQLADRNKINFIFIIGARRTGKTYGIFQHFINDVFSKNEKIIYMRRTKEQLTKVFLPEFDPWLDINKDMNRFFHFEKPRGEYGRIKIMEQTEEEEVYRGEAFCLTSMHNNRGFSGSDFSEGIYDEFIPEKIAKSISGEDDAFLNAVETISANRELQGKKPFRWWLASNSNTLDNAIVQAFGLLPILERMKKNKQEFSMLKERGIILVLINDSPISEKKKDTALYRALSGDTDFAKMALSNEFAYDDVSAIKSEDIRQYKLICVIGKIAIYEHKSKVHLYVSDHVSGSCKDVFEDTQHGKDQFRCFYSWIDSYRLTNRISYQNISVKFYIDKLFK